MNIAFLTLGCKVNKYETNIIKEKFETKGYNIVPFDSKADIYVVNSCSVTNMSDRKTRQMLSKARKQNPDAIIAIIGCSAENNKLNLEGYEEADILLGNESKMELVEVVEEYLKTGKKQKKFLEDISKVKRYKSVGVLNKGYEIREAIKIEDGCDNFCSYCIIPYLRGRVRSRSLEEIKKEALNLAKHGVKEIILVGIEVAAYGKDLENTSLLNVIDVLENIEGIERIRLSSIKPGFLCEETIKALSNYSKLCPHFHISMQSGNSKILKKMNRHYTKEDLIKVCKNLKKYFNNPYIASDIIVGFPGETEEDFYDTIDTVIKMGLTEIHVFKYSKRKGTAASMMPDQVDGNIKIERSKKLLELSNSLNEKYLNSYIGRNVEVLFENYTNGTLTGYTSNYIKVKAKGGNKLCGTIQDVVVTSLKKDTLQGNLN